MIAPTGIIWQQSKAKQLNSKKIILQIFTALIAVIVHTFYISTDDNHLKVNLNTLKKNADPLLFFFFFPEQTANA